MMLHADARGDLTVLLDCCCVSFFNYNGYWFYVVLNTTLQNFEWCYNSSFPEALFLEYDFVEHKVFQ